MTFLQRCTSTIYCNDDRECWNSTITTSGDSTDIQCKGVESCIFSNLSAPDSIDCSGTLSCNDAALSSDEIWCTGYKSCINSKTTPKVYHLNCAGSASCMHSKIKFGIPREVALSSYGIHSCINMTLIPDSLINDCICDCI